MRNMENVKSYVNIDVNKIWTKMSSRFVIKAKYGKSIPFCEYRSMQNVGEK